LGPNIDNLNLHPIVGTVNNIRSEGQMNAGRNRLVPIISDKEFKTMGLPLRSDEMSKLSPTEQKAISHTARGVAKLAGVSITTVSRVTNGATNVSEESRTKVMNAISRLQHSPNPHARELRRSKGSIPGRRGMYTHALTGTRVKTIYVPTEEQAERFPSRMRSQLSAEQHLQARRMLTRLSDDLEKLRSILQ